MGGLQVKVLGLATIATRNSHFSALEVRGYPKILFIAGGSTKILTISRFYPPLLSGGWSFLALSPPRSGPRPPQSCDREKPKIVKIELKFLG